MAKKAQPPEFHLTLTFRKDKNLNYSKILNLKTAHKRSTLRQKEKKSLLTIEIRAKDATALRASANSLFRDLQVIEATKP